MLGLPAPFVPHSASLSPATATRVLSTQVPVSAPPTRLDECLFSISLVSVPLAVRFSVSSGCARRRSVSTYAAILVPLNCQFYSICMCIYPTLLPVPHCFDYRSFAVTFYIKYDSSDFVFLFQDYFHYLSPLAPVSYTHLTLPTNVSMCRSRWSPYH